MRVGYLQFDPVFGEVAHNLDLVSRLDLSRWRPT
jgi:hypothetical protein